MKEICRLGVLSRLVLPAASLSGQFFSTKSMVNSIMLMLSSSSMEFMFLIFVMESSMKMVFEFHFAWIMEDILCSVEVEWQQDRKS